MSTELLSAREVERGEQKTGAKGSAADTPCPAYSLTLDFELVIDAFNPLNTSQRFLNHLLLVKGIDFASQNHLTLHALQIDFASSCMRISLDSGIDAVQKRAIGHWGWLRMTLCGNHSTGRMFVNFSLEIESTIVQWQNLSEKDKIHESICELVKKYGS